MTTSNGFAEEISRGNRTDVLSKYASKPEENLSRNSGNEEFNLKTNESRRALLPSQINSQVTKASAEQGVIISLQRK